MTVCSYISMLFITVFNDGTRKSLLQLDGTIPVNYKGMEELSFFSMLKPNIVYLGQAA